MPRCSSPCAHWSAILLAIPLHQLQSGSLLIFAFFMISDPKTTPASRLARFFFALAVAALAHYLAFIMQIRPALYIEMLLGWLESTRTFSRAGTD